jgi:hypothetical protein
MEGDMKVGSRVKWLDWMFVIQGVGVVMETYSYITCDGYEQTRYVIRIDGGLVVDMPERLVCPEEWALGSTEPPEWGKHYGEGGEIRPTGL